MGSFRYKHALLQRQPPVMDGRKGSRTVSTMCTYDGVASAPQADRSPCSTAASLPLPSSCRRSRSTDDQDDLALAQSCWELLSRHLDQRKTSSVGAGGHGCRLHAVLALPAHRLCHTNTAAHVEEPLRAVIWPVSGFGCAAVMVMGVSEMAAVVLNTVPGASCAVDTDSGSVAYAIRERPTCNVSS